MMALAGSVGAPGLPRSGVFPVEIGESLAGDNGKKRKRQAEDLVGFRCELHTIRGFKADK
jgi:hypothetical protein